MNGLQFSMCADSKRGPVEVRMEVDLYVRPDEIMIIREGMLVKDSLKQNILGGRILDITDRERYHTVYFQATGGVFFEISIPNYAFRNLPSRSERW